MNAPARTIDLWRLTAGIEVILADGEVPLARLVLLEQSAPSRIAGLSPGSIWTSDDFDEPLPDEFRLGTA